MKQQNVLQRLAWHDAVQVGDGRVQRVASGLDAFLEFVANLSPVGNALELSQLIGREFAHDRLHQLTHGTGHNGCDGISIMKGETQRDVLHLVAVVGRVGHNNHELLYIGFTDCRVALMNLVFVVRLPIGHRVVLAEVAHHRNLVIGFLLLQDQVLRPSRHRNNSQAQIQYE